MMNANSITIIVNHLNEARAYAVIAGLDHHFISEIDHLIATAEANKDEQCSGQVRQQEDRHRGKGRAVSKPNVREQIATMEYEDWIVDFCKSHEIKRPNRGSYADIIIKCLYGNLQKEISQSERMRVKIADLEMEYK